MKKLQEELIQSRKMQEKLNEQKRLNQNDKVASISPQSSDKAPRGIKVKKWAEIKSLDSSSFDYLYKKPIRKNAYELEKFVAGTRVLVLKQQGSWSRIKMEDKVVGWFYNAKFKWLE